MNTESQDIQFQLNEFYRDHYRRTMKWVSILVVAAAILSVILLWICYDQPQPAYYAAVTTGEVVPMHALSEPVVTSDFIIEWSALTARLIYNLNFSSYQDELNKAKEHFTTDGWEKMNASLKSSGLINNLVNNRLIISSVVSGPPVILSRLIIDGRFTWRVQMRMLVTFTSASAMSQRLMVVTMNIQRVSTLDASQGIQVIDFSARFAN